MDDEEPVRSLAISRKQNFQAPVALKNPLEDLSPFQETQKLLTPERKFKEKNSERAMLSIFCY